MPKIKCQLSTREIYILALLDQWNKNNIEDDRFEARINRPTDRIILARLVEKELAMYSDEYTALPTQRGEVIYSCIQEIIAYVKDSAAMKTP